MRGFARLECRRPMGGGDGLGYARRIDGRRLGKCGLTTHLRRFHMSSEKKTAARDRMRKAADQVKPMAEQVKPLAKTTKEAARRQWFRTRAWAAPRVEHTGKVLQETVAPKVSDLLSEAAERIDPAKPKRGRWRLPVGIATAIAAAASGAAAVLRKRSKTQTGSSTEATTGTTGTTDMGDGQATSVVDDKQAHAT